MLLAFRLPVPGDAPDAEVPTTALVGAAAALPAARAGAALLAFAGGMVLEIGFGVKRMVASLLKIFGQQVPEWR